MKVLLTIAALFLFTATAVADPLGSKPCDKAGKDKIEFSVVIVDGWSYDDFAAHIRAYADSKKLHQPSDADIQAAFTQVDRNADGVLSAAAGDPVAETLTFSYHRVHLI